MGFWTDMAQETGTKVMANLRQSKPTNLSTTEVDDMEILVDSAYRAYNENNPHRELFHPLLAYKRQYVAVIDGKGHKKVWINFFCGSLGSDWKHHVLIVDDGGICFFQMMIDLTQERVMWLYPNGAA